MTSEVHPKIDLIPLIKQWLDDGHRETKAAATKEEFYTWTEHYDNWICIVRAFNSVLPEFEKLNSMVLFRFVEVQKTLMWLYICVLSEHIILLLGNFDTFWNR